jgi:deoxyribodipyrimidine photolyase-related protein
MEAVLIFPHQLFKNHPSLNKERLILLVEHPRFFSDFKFHKQKLILHRASLKSFEKALQKKGFNTLYIEDDLETSLKPLNLSTIHIVELNDIPLEKDLFSLTKKLHIKTEVSLSPGFMTPVCEFQDLFKGKTHFNFATFYIYQRRKFDLLLDEKGKPLGGTWSLDSENRKKPPKSLTIPKSYQCPQHNEIKEATIYIEKNYPDNPGNSDSFNYPITHTDAKKALNDFLEYRLFLFGDYEDAMMQKEPILFHSCLSPLLNIGLLTPSEVIEETLHHCKNNEIPLNSLEGFIRQIIGWREFIRGTYHTIGEKQRAKNFFRHQRQLPKALYLGETGILPLDEGIQKLQNHAYLHHIERLMVFGNFFLLCEIDPNAVYKWFMELFIDAYDWVMVPNVYGMSQYADGGLMTTKPYFSGSNYILKMSNYSKGSWCDIWDALFWQFMIKNIKFFETQPRLNVLCVMAKNKQKDSSLINLAKEFLNDLK